MKKHTAVYTYIALLGVLLYLIDSFISAEFNIVLWEIDLRKVISIIFGIMTMAIILMYLIYLDK